MFVALVGGRKEGRLSPCVCILRIRVLHVEVQERRSDVISQNCNLQKVHLRTHRQKFFMIIYCFGGLENVL